MKRNLHVQAHRGASFEKRENSLESFQRALELGVDSIELDLHLLRDGTLVVYHDFFVPISSSKKGFICEHSFSEMKNLGAPSLNEVLDLVRSISSSGLLWLDLEIKYLENNPHSPERSKLVDAVLKQVSLHWELTRTRFRSFDWSILRVFQKSISSLQTIPLLGKEREDFERAMELQPEWLAPNVEGLNDESIHLVHRSGMKLMPYTVNTSAQWQKLIDWGVDGITTDDPRGLLHFIGR